MLSDRVYNEATDLINNFVNDLGELDPSLGGYIDLLNFAIEELRVNLNAAESDLDE